MAEINFNDPVVEISIAAIASVLMLIVLAILYFLKEREVKKLLRELDETREADTKAYNDLNVKYGELERELNGAKRVLGVSDFDRMTLVPIHCRQVVDITDGVYQYFVDKDKKAEFILRKAQKDISHDIIDKILKDDMIRWSNNYDPRDMRYLIEGDLLVVVRKGTDCSWDAGHELKEVY